MARPRASLSTVAGTTTTTEHLRESLSSRSRQNTDLLRSSLNSSNAEFRSGSTTHSSVPSRVAALPTRPREATEQAKSASELAIRPYVFPKDELPIDIDEDDKDNEIQCTQYVDDIYTYLRHLELTHRPIANYITKQPHLTLRHREESVDFQVQLHRHVSVAFKSSLQLETLFLCVSLLDRFLSRKAVTRDKLLLLSVSCFYVACKFEETYYPTIQQLLEFVPDAGRPEDVLLMERTILNELRYFLGAPTVVIFLKRYAKAAMADSPLGMAARFISEFCLMSLSLSTTYLPSMVAAASIAHGLRVMDRPPWTATLEKVTGYTYEQLRPCMVEMRDFVKKAPTMKFTTIYKKYSDSKYLNAALTAVRKI
ncbi:putative Cyclin [Monocercomonoides exilis]|uniref:putative Cyclin n=1 Tax=Monocercomonoides exilis TaxID=2049356 RepID=UPI0035599A6D|nr:putative Cyclin [Monocercomonoides exilis]|eukprot:MONOS_6377.1-p1 / transcript=MONOS_6377.1 / gene=MONOS_6377 / organism=Monocercomonoides_exilis_PA203 / gene_product=Cyclin / transcript_product=Cyclin / location=Mono_scaffold00200:30514-31775(+) / protein_length=367 / sequence_SO=supercontig / SO=protein_coding / is_pseudo=false